MSIHVRKVPGAPMRHVIQIRDHQLPTDLSVAEGGEDGGPDPHDLYDAALGACKALTVLWYAKRKGLQIDDIEVSVTRDATEERKGTYRLATEVRLVGNLTDAQRRELVSVAAKCPVHKLMTEVTTEITTSLAEG